MATSVTEEICNRNCVRKPTLIKCKIYVMVQGCSVIAIKKLERQVNAIYICMHVFTPYNSPLATSSALIGVFVFKAGL